MVFSIIIFWGGFVISVYMGSNIMRNLKELQSFYNNVGGSREGGSCNNRHRSELSVPYWFIWWIIIGMGYVIFARDLGMAGVLTFFAGHILSDLVWYSFISYGVQFGGKYLNLKIIKSILFVCSFFLIVFGVFFIFKGYNFIR